MARTEWTEIRDVSVAACWFCGDLWVMGQGFRTGDSYECEGCPALATIKVRSSDEGTNYHAVEWTIEDGEK